MATYRVRDGYRHGGRKQHGPGDVVELGEAEAAPFLDKLERVSDTSPDEPTPAPTTDDGGESDDLTAITGIGPATERTLNKAGVRTYADLMAIIDESPHLLRDAIGGVTGDKVEQWRAEAADLLEAE